MSEVTCSCSGATLIDVRKIVPRDRHALIFRTFDELKPGQAFHLLNDHDPQPLHYQFRAERDGAFSWAYLESGPDIWRVEIRRLA